MSSPCSVLLAVLTSYDAENKDKDAVGDYQIVKNRMNVCVTLQRDNPNIYRLRADFCMVRGCCCLVDCVLVSTCVCCVYRLRADYCMVRGCTGRAACLMRLCRICFVLYALLYPQTHILAQSRSHAHTLSPFYTITLTQTHSHTHSH